MPGLGIGNSMRFPMEKTLLDSFRRQLTILEAFERELLDVVRSLNHEHAPSSMTIRAMSGYALAGTLRD